MSSSWFLVQHLSNINKIIKHPLQSTQRIKFTCFDVSQNYIVFGATSGGLYVFNRYPATFLKLIPCKHGSVVQVAISPNDKNIAIASHKGLIVLIPNCFVESDVQYQVFTEHSGNLVTALKWNLDELYSGDSKGKITVITMPTVLSKTILHAPCSSLMQLDSTVVQIDCYSVYLLISTYTRTYVCNTEKEQFRQIGKQLRDANIGACFFSTVKDSAIVSDNTTMLTKINGGLFKNVKDDDSFNNQINDNIKIFCGRPGARLWEVKLDGSVTHTHHFKNYLKSDHTNIIKLKDKSDGHLNVINILSTKQNEMKLLNFTKVYVLKDKFIFTFNSEGFYVFNPETAAIVCWSNYFKGIKEAKVVGDLIYVLNEKEEILILAVNDLEKIITKTLFNEKYVTCADLCVAYIQDALSLVETSEKIHLVSILKEKLNDSTLLENLSPLFKALQEFADKKFAEQKLTSGIIAVNNLYANKNGTVSIEKNESDSSVSEAFQSLSDKISVSTKNVKEKFQILEATVKSLTSGEVVGASFTDHREQVETQISPNVKSKVKEVPVDWLKIYNQRYDLSNINSKLEMTKFDQLLISNTLDVNLSRFNEFRSHAINKGVNEEIIQKWCFRQFLKHLTKLNFSEELNKFALDDDVIEFTLTAFCDSNESSEHGCKCSYPLPSAKTKQADYYDIGCVILKKLWEADDKKCELIYRRVPFMWKFVLTKLNCSEDVNLLLPLLIQFGDENILRLFLNKFTYDTWDNAVQLLINLNKFKCINCDNKFETNCDIIKWTKFANVMIRSMGGSTTLNILTRYANFIPSCELDDTFYQTCIFATVVDNRRPDLRYQATDLVRNLHSNEETATEFDKMLGKFLQNKSTRKPSKCYPNAITSIEKTETKCSFCDLPFEIPILKYDIKLKCNHLFHKICLRFNNNVCNICKE